MSEQCTKCDCAKCYNFASEVRDHITSPAPETVELFVVQYRDRGSLRDWQSINSFRSSVAECRSDLGVARDVWCKEARVIKLAGAVVTE